MLNVGCLKLGVFCAGEARQALGEMIRDAKQRRAFGWAIAELGLIQRKILSSAARLYATECMNYRTVGMIDASLAELRVNRRSRRTRYSNALKSTERYVDPILCRALQWRSVEG